MVATIGSILNVWDEMGVFDYAIPFLLIFSVVFAILKKSKILTGKNADNKDEANNSVLAIISVAVALLSLRLNIVSDFFAVIFPRFGVGLSVFLCLLIFLGFFYPPATTDGKYTGHVTWIGWVVGIGAVIWAFMSWGAWGTFGFGGWINENFWVIIVLLLFAGAIGAVVKWGN